MMDEFQPPEEQHSAKEESSSVPEFPLKEFAKMPSGVDKPDSSREMAKGMKLVAWFHLAMLLCAVILYAVPLIVSGLNSGQPSMLVGLFYGAILFFELLAIIQLAYVIPALVIALAMRKTDMALGIATAMGLTFLLAGASFAVCTVNIFTNGFTGH